MVRLFSGPKALDLKYCRQPYLCLEVLTIHGNQLLIIHLNNKCRTSDIAAVGTTLNIFSYNAVWAENHLLNDERITLRYNRFIILYLSFKNSDEWRKASFL